MTIAAHGETPFGLPKCALINHLITHKHPADTDAKTSESPGSLWVPSDKRGCCFFQSDGVEGAPGYPVVSLSAVSDSRVEHSHVAAAALAALNSLFKWLLREARLGRL